jgi:hypothetical protein
MAANLQEAIDDVVEDIGTIGTSIPTVPTRMQTTWIPEMFTVPASFPAPGAPWDRQSANQRTVYDWSVPNIEANAEIQALGTQAVQQANIAINVVLRTLLAVQAAFAAGRITAAQVTSVVTAYTDAFE